MGSLAPESAAVWRGPMVMGALGKMVRETAWAPIDILFVDMPPGTGDAQISISQRLPLTGAVIVSNGGDCGGGAAGGEEGVDMYAKVNAPILRVRGEHGVLRGREVSERTCSEERRAKDSGGERSGAVGGGSAGTRARGAAKPPAAAAPESDVGKLYAAMAGD